MYLSEQMKQAIITQLMKSLGPIIQIIPKEDLERVVTLAQNIPQEHQLLRNQMNRIEQNQEAIMQHLGIPLAIPANPVVKQDAA